MKIQQSNFHWHQDTTITNQQLFIFNQSTKTNQSNNTNLHPRTQSNQRNQATLLTQSNQQKYQLMKLAQNTQDHNLTQSTQDYNLPAYIKNSITSTNSLTHNSSKKYKKQTSTSRKSSKLKFKLFVAALVLFSWILTYLYTLRQQQLVHVSKSKQGEAQVQIQKKQQRKRQNQVQFQVQTSTRLQQELQIDNIQQKITAIAYNNLLEASSINLSIQNLKQLLLSSQLQITKQNKIFQSMILQQQQQMEKQVEKRKKQYKEQTQKSLIKEIQQSIRRSNQLLDNQKYKRQMIDLGKAYEKYKRKEGQQVEQGQEMKQEMKQEMRKVKQKKEQEDQRDIDVKQGNNGKEDVDVMQGDNEGSKNKASINQKAQQHLDTLRQPSQSHLNSTTPPTLPPTSSRKNPISTPPSQHQRQPQQRLRPQFRTNTPAIVPQRDRYQFNLSTQQLIQRSQLSKAYPNPEQQWYRIRKPQYIRAIRLMQLVHNINYKGQYIFDHYNNYPSAQAKYQALSQLAAEEKQYYEKKYHISQYIHNQIGFCICVCSRNNAINRLYLRNLDSIFQQQYDNYHIVYINDASEDGTGDYVNSYMLDNYIEQSKYVIINNQNKQGTMKNLYTAAHKHCEKGQVMVFLDGDDSFIGRQVLATLNAVYQKYRVGLLYSQYFEIVNNADVKNGISRYIPWKELKSGKYRTLKNLYSIHINTMYVDVFCKIKVEDFQYQNGTFFMYTSDTGYMTPAIEMVGTRLMFLKEITYEYRHDAQPVHYNFKQHKPTMMDIFSRKPYQVLEQMPFADHPKVKYYP